MPATNFTPIQLYRSTTASQVPTSGNLSDGELAINTNDEKLYFKNSGGTVKLLASSAGASGDVVGPASATDNAVVRFDGTTGKLVQNSVVTIADSTGDVAGVGALTMGGNLTLSGGTANGVLYLNGSKVATSGSALTFDGTNLSTGNGSFLANGTTGITSFKATTSSNYAELQSRPDISYSRVLSSAYLLDIATLANQPILFTINSAEQMRLTSTGLGIGTSSPSYKLDVRVAPASGGAAGAGVTTGSYEGTILITGSAYNNYGVGANTAWLYSATNDVAIGPYGGSGTVQIVTGGARRATFDSSGNLGLGVTPSAWGSSFIAFESGSASNQWQSSVGFQTNNSVVSLNTNTFYNGSNYIYKYSKAASRFIVNSNSFEWQLAPSGTAGNAITFTQAMTLASNGSLGVGTTSPTLNSTGKTVHLHAGSGEWSLFHATTGESGAAGGDGTVIGQISLDGYLFNYEAGNLIFGTSGNERARITSGGDFQTSSGNSVMIGGTAARATTAGTNRLDIFDGTAPVGTLANGVSFYSTAGEARVMDAAGNATLLSPHDTKTNEWIFHSKHTPSGKVLRIDVERLLKFVNDHFGLDAVQEFIEP